jgi:glycosyltransferase involved in cell wall biosynthesis
VPRSDRFLFLARFSSIKGPLEVIQACKNSNAELDLVGDTSITNEPDLIRRCQEMADGKQIKIIGNQSRSETIHWYSQAKAMLHGNIRFREPYGLAPVEAMLCGIPCLCFDNGALRETVKHGETGLVCKSVEEFNRAVAEFDRNKFAPADAIRNWAIQFSVENMVERYESLCSEAIQTGGW